MVTLHVTGIIKCEEGGIMLITKTRKQGNSLVVTLPAAADNKLESNQEYYVSYSKDGAIILTPKIEDPFLIAEPGEYYEADVWRDMPKSGDELL